MKHRCLFSFGAAEGVSIVTRRSGSLRRWEVPEFHLRAHTRLDASVLRLSLATASRAPRNPGDSTAHEPPGYDWSRPEKPTVSSSAHWSESQKTGARVGEPREPSEPETG